ncbi:MAG: glycosyltransferase family 2 protein [Candidatus Krumholzibacteria bacterium]|jgi:cellulose synthase/poly-beta-1,6-N-acetylglucosamine synthase-like glycosyltransferase|nr:glycosyltransferase family 2 protein [Candidatus Krumholzibacteria bacterium]
METLFAILVFVVIYAYIGYPLLLYLASRLSAGKSRRAPGYEEEDLPFVSLLIAARNEEKIIARKIENALELNYPHSRLEIVVVSDGSTDGTDEIVRGYASRGVSLLRVEGNGGKTIARNIAVERCRGKIIVFSDSNAMYDRDAVRKLVLHFSDPLVGVVCGALRLVGEDGGENHYWRYEKWIKTLEDRTHSIIGANGSIYAIRRELYRPLGAGIDDDFIEPVLCYMDGYELRYEPEALSVERDIPGSRLMDEFGAKKRVVMRGLQSLASISAILNPFRFPALAFELFSHKILKWMVPFILIAIFVDNLFLTGSRFFELTLAMQILFYSAAAAGIIFRTRSLHVPAFFVLTNLSVFAAVLSWFAGNRNVSWGK